jgi:DNA-binding SARP family transcriptional activator
MQFGVLGPLTVARDGAPIRLRAAMLRRLLAVLLCRTPHPLAATEAIEALWGAGAPATARKTLQVYMHRLRLCLGEERISHSPAGYVIHADVSECDALRFADLVDRGLAAYRQTRLDQASVLLDRALGLWRGAAYADVAAGVLVEQEAARLQERYLLAAEELMTVELERGRFAETVPRLFDLVAAHPYRESLRGQLMTALYHAGRQAEALEVYRGTRALLATELAVEPTPELQRLHAALLRGDLPRPAPAAESAPVPVPRELPRDVWPFTGRADALEFLDAALPERGDPPPGAVVISAVCGMPGVGKTSLAVHWAHRVLPRFPDGQLYVDLRGYAPDGPVRPVDALALFLRALGVAADEVPVDLELAMRRYRTLLADRRILVVLDNARDAHQVRPLLPGGPDCLVVVTSRERLTGLVARNGARQLVLDTLPPAESQALIELILAGAGVPAAPAETAQIAAACGHLPLALRIAAAHIIERRDAGGYLAALRGQETLAGLDVAGDAEASVKATFDLSYRTLAPTEQALFRLLGPAPGRDITPDAAAALVGDPPQTCQRLLDTLAAAHLVVQHRPGRYTLHDLLRRYAHGLALTRDGQATTVALGRLYDFYLSTVDAAARLLYPAMVRIPLDPPGSVAAFPDEAAALAWLDDELPNLVDVTAHAAAHGPHPAAWLLADALRGYFWVCRHAGAWLVTARAGVAAARAAGDRPGQAAGELSLALAHRSLADFDAAVEHATAALAIARDIDWLDVQASALSSLAVAYAETGQTRAALARLTEAEAVVRRLGEPLARARLLGNISTLRHNMGDLRGSLDDALESIALCEGAGSGIEALALSNAGGNYICLGDHTRAAGYLAQSYDLFERTGQRYGQSVTESLWARLHIETGDHTTALRHATAALGYSRDAHDQSVEAAALTDLAVIRAHLGNYQQALRDAAEAVDTARRARSCHPEVEALIALAGAHLHAGQTADALDTARHALALAEEREYRLLRATALTTIAAGHLATGDRHSARAAGLTALQLHEQTGFTRGVEQTRAILARAGQTGDDTS